MASGNSRARRPAKVRKGGPARASTINDLIDLASRAVVGGPGIDVTMDERRIVVSLSRAVYLLLREHLIPAVITAANGSLPDDLPANVTYNAAIRGQDQDALTAVVPLYGRRLDNVRIVKAPVHSLCFIVRVPDSDGVPTAGLWVLNEKEATENCGSGFAGGDAGGGNDPDAGLAALVDLVADELVQRGLMKR